MEKIDGVCFRRNVKVVEITEELGRALADAEPAARTGRRFVVDGLKHLESRGNAFPFLIEDKGAVFHPAGGEEANVAVSRKFLRGAAG